MHSYGWPQKAAAVAIGLTALALLAAIGATEAASSSLLDTTPTPAGDQQPPAGIEAPRGEYSPPGSPADADARAAPSTHSAGSAPAVSTGFDGIGMEDDSDGFVHTPPDTHAATGLDRIVELTNGHVAIYGKTGGLIAGGDSGPGAVDLDAFCGREGCFDPKVTYDQVSNRFVAVVLEGFDSTDTWLHLMVSKTSSPGNLSTDWDKFRHFAGANISGTDGWFDYPGLGVSPDAVVVTGNIFPDVGSLPLGTKIRVYDKAELYDGDASATFVDLDDTFAASGFTIQPAHHLSSPPSGTFYMLQQWNSTFLRVIALTGVPSSPSVNEALLSTSDQGACIDGANQQGTSVTVDTVCLRLMNAVYRDGSLWGTNTGSDATDTRAVVQWYEVQTNGFPSASPTLRQHGAVDGGSGEHTFMPSISVNNCGNAAMTYTQSSASRYPEMRYTVREAADPLNSMQAPGVAKTSVGFHDDFSSSPDRWGDYSSTVIDPANQSFWITHEYVRAAASGFGDDSRWGTWHANFALPCDLGVNVYLPVVLNNWAPPTLLQNGDFESGPTAWTEYSQQNYLLILDDASLPITPYGGNWAVWLAGDDNETSYIEQVLTVPPSQPYLGYQHWISSLDSCGYDFASVRINGGIVDQYDLCSSVETGGWEKHVVNLSAYAGQTVTLQIYASADATTGTWSSLFVDHVAWQSGPLKPEDRVGAPARDGDQPKDRKPDGLR